MAKVKVRVKEKVRKRIYKSRGSSAAAMGASGGSSDANGGKSGLKLIVCGISRLCQLAFSFLLSDPRPPCSIPPPSASAPFSTIHI